MEKIFKYEDFKKWYCLTISSELYVSPTNNNKIDFVIKKEDEKKSIPFQNFKRLKFQYQKGIFEDFLNYKGYYIIQNSEQIYLTKNKLAVADSFFSTFEQLIKWCFNEQ